jgi:hypothetical protein
MRNAMPWLSFPMTAAAFCRTMKASVSSIVQDSDLQAA